MSTSSQESISPVVQAHGPLDRLAAVVAALWSAPHRWENLATRFGVAAVLTMSAIQTAFFFGLASPDPVEKAKAVVFSGWMDFCLFMTFIRAQRSSAQEAYGKAVAWFLGCLPLASFTFLCNFMFSSHWQPPDPLALERVGLNPLVALWIYACVPLVAVVYGTLFTVKEITREEKLRRQQAKAEALWQTEIADPRGRLRKMRLMRRVLAEQVGLDLDEGDEEDHARFGAYEGLLAERGISLVDREAPLRFEALLQEMLQLGIQPRASNAVALFRSATASPTPTTVPAPASRPQGAQTGKQISLLEQRSLDVSTSTGKRSFSEHSPPAVPQAEQITSVSSHPWTLAAEALQSMLADDSGAWTTYLTLEEFVGETGYNANDIKKLVRTGNIKAEEQHGVRRIPLAELARFALDRVSEELAERVFVRQAAGEADGAWVVEADRGEPFVAAPGEADAAET